jgi:hypothetical protein
MTAPERQPPERSPRPYHYTSPKDDSRQILRWARILLTIALIPLGLNAFRNELGSVPLVSDIDTAVHEFGHYLFMPLGDTMTILGGSLFQIVFPLVFVGYFFFGKQEHRDPHAATVCLWWASVNVLSVSIYAADARARELMLLSGATGQDDDSGHDFYNLFSRWGVLQHDTLYASELRKLAWAMFAVSIGAGLWTAWQSGSSPVRAKTFSDADDAE